MKSPVRLGGGKQAPYTAYEGDRLMIPSGDGGANKTSPSSWDDERLGDIFSTAYTKSVPTWYPYQSSLPSTPTSTSHSSNINHRTLVIPLAVGLSVPVACGIFCVFFLWLYKRHRFTSSHCECKPFGVYQTCLRLMGLPIHKHCFAEVDGTVVSSPAKPRDPTKPPVELPTSSDETPTPSNGEKSLFPSSSPSL